MVIHEVRASGLEYLALATELLQRARVADAEAGVWEAADLQWWWRTPRRSDAIDHLFWIDDGPHPMRRRSGEGVDARLMQCSLYDPGLDLAVEAADGQTAGYALFWFDPVTEVGPVEPMRVEDAYRQRGLASAMLTTGLDRLARRGAHRLKVGYGTDVARGLYVGAGFRVTSTSTSYSWRRPVATG